WRKSKMFEQLADLVASELSVSRATITRATHLQDDLGADSLDAVELIMSIEDKFEVSIPEDVASNLKTVGDIMNFLENNL
ncbi:MAG: acyl carrier protein, partial [Candidatus Izemoplasmatales bacterium]|nr:acyl carrier protein [Candidatus Izemoplasmatales bacterium]